MAAAVETVDNIVAAGVVAVVVVHNLDSDVQNCAVDIGYVDHLAFVAVAVYEALQKLDTAMHSSAWPAAAWHIAAAFLVTARVAAEEGNQQGS